MYLGLISGLGDGIVLEFCHPNFGIKSTVQPLPLISNQLALYWLDFII